MVRTYYRKTEKVPREILIGALRHLKLLDNLNLQKIAYWKVAEGFGIPKSTLFSHYQKVKDLDSIPENYLSNEVHNRQILKYKEEEELVEYQSYFSSRKGAFSRPKPSTSNCQKTSFFSTKLFVWLGYSHEQCIILLSVAYVVLFIINDSLFV